MKAIIQCYTPEECERIANGEQTVKVCKTAPKDTPFKVYIYQTKESKRRFLDHRFNSFFAGTSHYKDMGKVIGEFICDRIEKFSVFENDTVQNWNYAELCNSCLSYDEVSSYIGKDKIGYAWHISELKIYDKPKELREFVKPCNWNYDCCTCKRAIYELTKAEARLFYGCNRELTHPPQSWCYVEEN